MGANKAHQRNIKEAREEYIKKYTATVKETRADLMGACCIQVPLSCLPVLPQMPLSTQPILNSYTTIIWQLHDNLHDNYMTISFS